MIDGQDFNNPLTIRRKEGVLTFKKSAGCPLSSSLHVFLNGELALDIGTSFMYIFARRIRIYTDKSKFVQ